MTDLRPHTVIETPDDRFAVHSALSNRKTYTGHVVPSLEVAVLRNAARRAEMLPEQYGKGVTGYSRRLKQVATTHAIRAAKMSLPPAGYVHSVAKLLQRMGRSKAAKHVLSEDEHALLAAKLAYRSQEERAKHPVMGRRYRPDLSDAEFAAFERAADSPAIVAHRGSITKEDWVDSDRHVLLGTLEKSARAARARRAVKKAREALTPDGGRLLHTGHSLGGSLAHMTARDHDEDALTFNPGVGLGVGEESPLREHGGHQRIYSVSGDAVSGLTTIKAPHSTDVRLLEAAPGLSEESAGLAHMLHNFRVQDSPAPDSDA